ncbi:hypothetical protein BDZ89DRAFT_1046471 [Hymenopellis radicata]|nr:hypothetical protein BDZ89DRAFT_1046471 [Hymenopellis radicata]
MSQLGTDGPRVVIPRSEGRPLRRVQNPDVAPYIMVEQRRAIPSQTRQAQIETMPSLKRGPKAYPSEYGGGPGEDTRSGNVERGVQERGSGLYPAKPCGRRLPTSTKPNGKRTRREDNVPYGRRRQGKHL